MAFGFAFSQKTLRLGVMLLLETQEGWYPSNSASTQASRPPLLPVFPDMPGSQADIRGNCLGLPTVQPELCSGMHSASGLDLRKKTDLSTTPENLPQDWVGIQADLRGDRLGLPALDQDKLWSPRLLEPVPMCPASTAALCCSSSKKQAKIA